MEKKASRMLKNNICMMIHEDLCFWQRHPVSSFFLTGEVKGEKKRESDQPQTAESSRICAEHLHCENRRFRLSRKVFGLWEALVKDSSSSHGPFVYLLFIVLSVEFLGLLDVSHVGTCPRCSAPLSRQRTLTHAPE